MSILSSHLDMVNARVEFAGGAVASMTSPAWPANGCAGCGSSSPSGYISLDLATGAAKFMRLREGWRPGTGNSIEEIVESTPLAAPEADALGLELAASSPRCVANRRQLSRQPRAGPPWPSPSTSPRPSSARRLLPLWAADRADLRGRRRTLRGPPRGACVHRAPRRLPGRRDRGGRRRAVAAAGRRIRSPIDGLWRRWAWSRSSEQSRALSPAACAPAVTSSRIATTWSSRSTTPAFTSTSPRRPARRAFRCSGTSPRSSGPGAQGGRNGSPGRSIGWR